MGTTHRVAVFGAGGILGQTMRLSQPPSCEVRYYRRHADALHCGIELTDDQATTICLDRFDPQTVINLAGENRPDVVEQAPGSFHVINVLVPQRLAAWCDDHKAHYIHMSTQAVFSGDHAPYEPESDLSPINAYGQQKTEAERLVRTTNNWTIMRPTLVLGIRPLPHVGRENPAEQMLRHEDTGRQVNDRWFSTVTARAAAYEIWQAVAQRPLQHTFHLGGPNRACRCDLAAGLGCKVEPCSHEDFPGLAPRPRDTTYGEPCSARAAPEDLPGLRSEWVARQSHFDSRAAIDLALFFGLRESVTVAQLAQGFHYHHARIGKEYQEAAPKTDADILDWYRKTEGYIWELTAYHVDDGFNYGGMCRGLADHLEGHNQRVLCIADGVGQVTLSLRARGVDAVYHDLKGSRTAAFAEFRLALHGGGTGETILAEDWAPQLPSAEFDCVLCLDFLEHVPDVPVWVRAIHETLKPGGQVFFQNAFACGSGIDGSIPMHLKCNDHWEQDWAMLLADLGFAQVGTSNWWRRSG